MSAFEILENEPDPDVVTDSAAIAGIGDSGFPWRIVHRPSGIVMLLCPKGEFWMGSHHGEWGSSESEDELRHPRDIRAAFYLSQTAVTQAQWSTAMGSNPSYFQGADHPNSENRPVEQVNWHDCHIALRTLGDGLRLPTEAEWEYACRAGTTGAYSFGNEVGEGQVCFGMWNGPVPCGSLPANPWGLHEMHGNIWEWCEDSYAAYPSSGGTEQAAVGVTTRIRIIRGGSWLSHAATCRSSSRFGTAAINRCNGVGFRVARSAHRLFD